MAAPKGIRPVRVVRVITGWDMRASKKLAFGKEAGELNTGEAVVAFNNSETIARVIDSQHNCLTMWAPVGEKFDLQLVGEKLANGLYITLTQAKKLKVAA